MTNQCPMKCCNCKKPPAPTQGISVPYYCSDTEEFDYSSVVPKSNYPVSNLYTDYSNGSQNRHNKHAGSDPECSPTGAPSCPHSPGSCRSVGGLGKAILQSTSIDYDPESTFLKNMKAQRMQLAQDEQGCGTDFMPFYCDKSQQIDNAREEVAQCGSPYSEEEDCDSDNDEVDDAPCEHCCEVENNRKSQHVSRSKTPGNRGRKKQKGCADENPSQISFQPTLKQPHEDSCERCWRYASPARSPVNKPEQKYDPNFRRSHSRMDFDRGGGDVQPSNEEYDYSDSNTSICQRCGCPESRARSMEQQRPINVQMTIQPASNVSGSGFSSSPRLAYQEGLPKESLMCEKYHQMAAARSSPQPCVNMSRSPRSPSSPTNQECSNTPFEYPICATCHKPMDRFSQQQIGNRTRSPVGSPPPTQQECTRMRSPSPTHQEDTRVRSSPSTQQEGTRVRFPSPQCDENMEISPVRNTPQTQSGLGNLLETPRISSPIERGRSIYQKQADNPGFIRSRPTTPSRLSLQSIPTTPVMSRPQTRSPCPVPTNDDTKCKRLSLNMQQQHHNTRLSVSPKRGDSSTGTKHLSLGNTPGLRSVSPGSAGKCSPQYACSPRTPVRSTPGNNVSCNRKSMSKTPKKEGSSLKVNRSKHPSPQKSPKSRKSPQQSCVKTPKSSSKIPVKGTCKVSPSKFKSTSSSKIGSRCSPAPMNKSKHSPRRESRSNLPSKINSTRDDRERTFPIREPERVGFSPKFTSTPKRRPKCESKPRPEGESTLPSKICSIHDDTLYTPSRAEEREPLPMLPRMPSPSGFSPKFTSTPKRGPKSSPRPEGESTLPSKICSIHEDRLYTSSRAEERESLSMLPRMPSPNGFSPKFTSTPKRRSKCPRPEDESTLPSKICSIHEDRQCTPLRESGYEPMPMHSRIPSPRCTSKSSPRPEDRMNLLSETFTTTEDRQCTPLRQSGYEPMPMHSRVPSPRGTSKSSPRPEDRMNLLSETFTTTEDRQCTPLRESGYERVPSPRYTSKSSPRPEDRMNLLSQTFTTTEDRQCTPLRESGYERVPSPRYTSKSSPRPEDRMNHLNETFTTTEDRQCTPLRESGYERVPSPRYTSKSSPRPEDRMNLLNETFTTTEDRQCTPLRESGYEPMPMHSRIPSPRCTSKSSPRPEDRTNLVNETFSMPDDTQYMPLAEKECKPPAHMHSRTSSSMNKSKHCRRPEDRMNLLTTTGDRQCTPVREARCEPMPMHSFVSSPTNISKHSRRPEDSMTFPCESIVVPDDRQYAPPREEECESIPMTSYASSPMSRSKHSPRPDNHTTLQTTAAVDVNTVDSMEVPEYKLNSCPKNVPESEYAAFNPRCDVKAQISHEVPRNSRRRPCSCCNNCTANKYKEQETKEKRMCPHEDSNREPLSRSLQPNRPHTAGECSGMTSKQRLNQSYPCSGTRKYVVYYMTQCKDNKGGDVEVLVEELSKTSPSEEDARTKNMEKKMKQILENPTDSMALRFQKGVTESLKTPQTSRILYF